MSDEPGRATRTRDQHSGLPHKRHWLRRILLAVGLLVVLIVVVSALAIKPGHAEPPLTLPTAGANTPVGPTDGTWHAGPGSVAGFRLKERFFGMGDDVVGRTNAVTGTMTISGDRVTTATFRVGLTTVKVGGKTQAQFAKSLDTRDDPDAAFTLTQPVTLSSAVNSGAVIAVTATGQLTMRGASHLVTFTISGRRNGATLETEGSIPIVLSEWGIGRPRGYGFLGSLADHGVAEFLFVLRRQ